MAYIPSVGTVYCIEWSLLSSIVLCLSEFNHLYDCVVCRWFSKFNSKARKFLITKCKNYFSEYMFPANSCGVECIRNET